jgi:hypothetical protein
VKNIGIQKTDVVLFSQLDPVLTHTVRRIPAKHDRFATDFIGVNGDDNKVIMAIRLEAWKDAATGSWAIDRLIYTPALNAVTKDIEARPGLCFFDALYYCARFQMTELASHDSHRIVTVHGKRWADTPHFTVAAKEAGQVIDHDGLAHPCANGRILTTGMFDNEALDTAYETAKTPLTESEPVMPGLLESFVGASLAPLSGDPIKTIIGRAAHKAKIVKSFEDVIDSGQNLMLRMAKLKQNKFRPQYRSHVLGTVFGTVCTLGIAPAIGHLAGFNWFTMTRDFLLFKTDFLQKVENLPDCPEKNAARDFAKIAEYTFWMERALLLLEEFKAAPDKEKLIKRAMPYIEKAGVALGLDHFAVKKLQEDFGTDCIEKNSCFKKLGKAWGTRFEYHRNPGDTIGEYKPETVNGNGLKYKFESRIKNLDLEILTHQVNAETAEELPVPASYTLKPRM